MEDQGGDLLSIRLFGPFACRLEPGARDLRLGAKPSALLALLATAPEGQRTRHWLQDMLWSLSGPEHGRASLRQALSGLRRALGAEAGALLAADNATVSLDLARVRLLGEPRDGAFLEGIEIRGEEAFDAWLRQQRQSLAANAPGTLAAVGLARLSEEPRLRPAAAILPFATPLRGETSAVIGDLIAADLSRVLSRAAGVDVISHLSCRQREFRESDLRELRGRFSVDYLVAGHYRLNDRTLVINADVIDVETGRLCATERFDCPAAALSAGEETAIHGIARFLADAIFGASVRTAMDRGTRSAATHKLLLSAITLMHRQDLASFSRAREQLEEIVRRTPAAAVPRAWLAKWYVLFVSQGWSTDVAGDAARAEEHVGLALAADPGCTFSRTIEGLVAHQLLKDYGAASRHFDMVLSVDENDALAWLLKGTMHAFAARGPEAVAYTDRANRLSPLDPSRYLFEALTATARLANGDHAGALAHAERSIALNRHHVSSLRAKVVALHGLGRLEEGRATARELLRREPDLTVRRYLSNHAAAPYATGRDWAHALHACGVPMK